MVNHDQISALLKITDVSNLLISRANPSFLPLETQWLARTKVAFCSPLVNLYQFILNIFSASFFASFCKTFLDSHAKKASFKPWWKIVKRAKRRRRCQELPTKFKILPKAGRLHCAQWNERYLIIFMFRGCVMYFKMFRNSLAFHGNNCTLIFFQTSVQDGGIQSRMRNIRQTFSLRDTHKFNAFSSQVSKSALSACTLKVIGNLISSDYFVHLWKWLPGSSLSKKKNCWKARKMQTLGVLVFSSDFFHLTFDSVFESNFHVSTVIRGMPKGEKGITLWKWRTCKRRREETTRRKDMMPRRTRQSHGNTYTQSRLPSKSINHNTSSHSFVPFPFVDFGTLFEPKKYQKLR